MKLLLLITAAAGVLAAPMLASAQTPAQQQEWQAQHDRQMAQHDEAMAAQHQAAANWDRNNAYWWRGRPEFNGYVGVRPGAWFIPGRGYVTVGPQWWGYHWGVGVVVPRTFWSYYVPNPGFYNLPPAPPGFAYIFLGNNIALINLNNGRIITMVPNIY